MFFAPDHDDNQMRFYVRSTSNVRSSTAADFRPRATGGFCSWNIVLSANTEICQFSSEPRYVYSEYNVYHLYVCVKFCYVVFRNCAHHCISWTKVGAYYGFDVTPPPPRPRPPQTLSCSEHNSKTDWNILTKHHPCIDNDSKVCRAQERRPSLQWFRSYFPLFVFRSNFVFGLNSNTVWNILTKLHSCIDNDA